MRLSSAVIVKNSVWCCMVMSLLQSTAGLRLYKDSDQGSGDYSDELSVNSFSRPIAATGKFTLQSNINEFIELMPVLDVKAKILEYYKNDADVQHLFAYAHSKDFWSMKKNVCDVREVKELEAFFTKIGVNIKETLYKFDDLLGISKVKQPPQFGRGANTSNAMYTQTTIGGLYGLLEDILALLPQDEIFILFFEKLDSSIEFSNMVESIGSQEFGMKFDSLKKSSELRKLLGELQKHKIDVKKIIELFQSFFLFGTF